MTDFKPIKRHFVPKTKVNATLAIPVGDKEQAQAKADAEVVEIFDEEGWRHWQDAVFVHEFTEEVKETLPGGLY